MVPILQNLNHCLLTPSPAVRTSFKSVFRPIWHAESIGALHFAIALLVVEIWWKSLNFAVSCFTLWSQAPWVCGYLASWRVGFNFRRMMWRGVGGCVARYPRIISLYGRILILRERGWTCSQRGERLMHADTICPRVPLGTTGRIWRKSPQKQNTTPQMVGDPYEYPSL